MWGKIYSKLKDEGLNPYPPGKHKGECEENYCVIRESNQVPYHYSNQVGYKLFDIILFVPEDSYIQINPYVNKIRKAMKGLSFLRKTGNETPIIIDDRKKAYTMSIEYQIMKALEG